MSLTQLVKCALAGVLTLGSEHDPVTYAKWPAGDNRVFALREEGAHLNHRPFAPQASDDVRVETLLSADDHAEEQELSISQPSAVGESRIAQPPAESRPELEALQANVEKFHGQMVASVDQFMTFMGSAIGHNADRFWLKRILEIKGRLALFQTAVKGMGDRAKSLTNRVEKSDPLHEAAGKRLGRARANAATLALDGEDVKNVQLGNVERLLKRVYCKLEEDVSERPECNPNADRIFEEMLKAREAAYVMGDEEKAMFSYLESNIQNDAMRDEALVLSDAASDISSLVALLNEYDHVVRGTVDSDRDGVFEYQLAENDELLKDDMDDVVFTSLEVTDVTEGLPSQVIPYHSQLAILAYQLREASRVIAGIDDFKIKAAKMIGVIKQRVAMYKNELSALLPYLAEDGRKYLVVPTAPEGVELDKHETTRRNLILSALAHARRSMWVHAKIDKWVPQVMPDTESESKTPTDSLKITASPHADDIEAAVQCLVFDFRNGAAGSVTKRESVYADMCKGLNDIMGEPVARREANIA